MKGSVSQGTVECVWLRLRRCPRLGKWDFCSFTTHNQSVDQPQAACAVPVMDGMKVKTNSAVSRQAR